MCLLLRRGFKCSYLALLIISMVARFAFPQSDPEHVGPVLGEEILAPSVNLFQVRKYLLSRVAPPPTATSAQRWTAEASRIRQHLLRDVVFHGWPADWVNSPPKFEEVAVIETGNGYKLRKLRYEIVPGFYSVAILYEPEHLVGKVPAILNVNGHEPILGKAAEYKQKRCINYAKHGIMALNIEWLWCGELHQPENTHWNGAHLGLVGANELGLFFLEMRRGLDYLYDHPNVDRNRLGVTGLSGGGWQTITISSLDERVKVAVPVAGFSSIDTRLEVRQYGDLGDVEQSAPDSLDGQDFTHLIAMMAPRPTLLAYNAEDDCCFRAPLVKPLLFDGTTPFFRLYGKEDSLEWHENRDPGTHNYDLDNRQAAYRFFSKHFNLPVIESEIPVGQEIKSYDELAVGLPTDNLTILGLARKLGSEITRPPVPLDPATKTAWAASERQKLSAVVRYKPVHLARLWTLANTKSKGVETKSYLFEMNNGLSANGVWLKAIETPEKNPLTIVLHDRGKKAAGVEVSDRVNRDEQVLALDLLFMGDSWKEAGKEVEPYLYAQIFDGFGDRPLGVEAAQLIEIAHWVRGLVGVSKVRLECTGIRTQTVAAVAAALQPDLFDALVVHEGMPSLGFLLQVPVTFQEAPELFCLDLYKDFDLDRLTAMASPTQVTVEKYVEIPKQK